MIVLDDYNRELLLFKKNLQKYTVEPNIVDVLGRGLFFMEIKDEQLRIDIQDALFLNGNIGNLAMLLSMGFIGGKAHSLNEIYKITGIPVNDIPDAIRHALTSIDLPFKSE